MTQEKKGRGESAGKTGLVLEGGAMRGMFTAGVLDVMMENGIEFDRAVGVSAGAVFGCNLKSRQIGRVIRYNTRFSKEWRYCSVRSLLLTGDLYGADFCYNKLPYELDLFDTETYRKNPMEFYAVCTDVRTGKAFYRKNDVGDGEDMEWFRASASMPVASRPVRIGDSAYLDGGISDSIPLKFMEDTGCTCNTVVLTQPEDYRKKPLSIMPLLRVLLRKYPALVKDLECRHETYNREADYVRRREKEGKVFVIRPAKSLEIGSVEHDPEELRRVYRIGRETMEARLDALEGFRRAH